MDCPSNHYGIVDFILSLPYFRENAFSRKGAMKQIIISRLDVRNPILCPNCNSFSFTNLNKMLREKKFTCYECRKTTKDISKLIIKRDVRRYIEVFFKEFGTPIKDENEEGIDFVDKIMVCAELEYQKDFDKILNEIKKSRIGWHISEPKEDMIVIKQCPNCGYCKICGKAVTLKKEYNSTSCSECGNENFRYIQVKGDACPNCNNKNLINKDKKIMTAIVSIEHIRKMFYDGKTRSILKL